MLIPAVLPAASLGEERRLGPDPTHERVEPPAREAGLPVSVPVSSAEGHLHFLLVPDLVAALYVHVCGGHTLGELHTSPFNLGLEHTGRSMPTC